MLPWHLGRPQAGRGHLDLGSVALEAEAGAAAAEEGVEAGAPAVPLGAIHHLHTRAPTTKPTPGLKRAVAELGSLGSGRV